MGILGVAGAETCVIGDGIFFGGTDASGAEDHCNEFDGCAWTTGGTMLTNVKPVCAGGISSNAIQGAGSQNGDSTKYNGSSWSSITAFPYERGESTSGDGDDDDAMLAGGYGHASGSNQTTRRSDSHTWNGSSWTSSGMLPWSETYQARTVDGARYGGDAGGGMIVGGAYGTGTSWNGYAWTWNGSSWSTQSNAYAASGGGTVGAQALTGGGNASAFTAGVGYSGAYITATEKFNGTSWSSAGNTTSGHVKGVGGGSGSATGSYNVIICSGQTPSTYYSLVVDRYDGTAWAAAANLLVGSQEAGAGFRG